MIFETERLIIRRYTREDLVYFARLNGDTEIMRYIRPVQTLAQSREFLENIIKAYDEQPGRGRWGMFAKHTGAYTGSFAVIPVENSDELQLGYALLKENWGKGYATEVVKGGLKYAFDILKLQQIAGITFKENIPSQRVLLNNGFVFSHRFNESGNELNVYIRHKDPPA